MLAQDDFNSTFTNRCHSAVITWQIISVIGVDLLDFDNFNAIEKICQEVNQTNRMVAPTSILSDCKGRLMISILSAWESTLLVEVFIWDSDNQVATGFDDTNPIVECFGDVNHVLQAVATKDEVKAIITNSCHELGVTILPVPRFDGLAKREELHIQLKRVRFATNVDALSNKVFTHEVGIRHSTHYTLATLSHVLARLFELALVVIQELLATCSVKPFNFFFQKKSLLIFLNINVAPSVSWPDIFLFQQRSEASQRP